MIFLDTNVISELMREESDGTVARWLDQQIAASVWTTSVVEMEIRYGIESLATGRRRELLDRTFEKFLEDVLEFRVAAFDRSAARAAAELMADRRRRGHPGEIRDTLIAGIALASNATVATRNVLHFADCNVSVVNPWKG